MGNRIADAAKSTAETVQEKSSKLAETARDQAGRAGRAAENFVKEHPALCVGAAVAVGIALGWWIKRK